jgi:hypothetical protein
MNGLKLFLISILSVIFIISCRDWFGENNNPEPISINQPPPISSITITQPEYASVWKPGDSMIIKWITSFPIEKVDIELYRKTNFQFYLVKGKVNDGIYQWQIPEAINQSVHYKIKISNSDRNAETTISRSFAIID